MHSSLVCTSLVPLLALLLGTAATVLAAPVQLKTVRTRGGIEAAFARRLLRVRLGSGPRCAKIGVRVSFSARITKSGQIKLTKVSPLTSRHCLQRKFARRFPAKAKLTTIDVAFAWRRSTAAEQRAARLHKRLAGKISNLGLLKVLGAGSGTFGGSLSSRMGWGGLRGTGIGGGGIGQGLGLPRGKGRSGYLRQAAVRRAHEARRVAAEKQRAQALKKALRLPRWRGKQARWWQEEPSGHGWWTPAYTPEALGPDLAIVRVTVKHQARGAKEPRRTTHHVLLDRKRIGGLVRFPKPPRWVGIDAAKHVYFVDAMGQLRGAPLEQALTGTFSKLARLAPGGRWEASGARIAVLAAGRSSLSKDGGRHFVPITAPKALGAAKVQDFALRPDGLLAVVFEAPGGTGTGTTLQLTRDDGRTWAASSFQPLAIKRIGGVIWARHGCGIAALAADGKRWISTSLPNARGWGEALARRGGYARGGLASDATPAPQVTARTKVITATQPEACSGGGRGGLAGGGSWTSGATGCRRSGFGAQCLRGSAGQRHARSFAAAYRLRHTSQAVAFVDHRTGGLTFGTLPKSCPRPQRIEFVPGSTLLVCPHAEGPLGEARTELFFATAGTWSSDGVLPARSIDLRPVAFADDCTLLLQACDYNRQREQKEGNGYLCARAWVRRPVPLGSPKAWREVRRTDMLAYRPLAGGRALLIDRAKDNNAAIQLYIESAKRIRPFGPPIAITRDFSNVTIEDRTIRFHDRGSRFILLPQGKLTPFPRD